MAFSNLPTDFEEALKEVKMWREKYRTQRHSLTDEQINRIAKNYALNNPTTPLHFARAIEAAHQIYEDKK